MYLWVMYLPGLVGIRRHHNYLGLYVRGVVPVGLHTVRYRGGHAGVGRHRELRTLHLHRMIVRGVEGIVEGLYVLWGGGVVRAGL